jgi:hypothetical protein
MNVQAINTATVASFPIVVLLGQTLRQAKAALRQSEAARLWFADCVK